MNFLKFSVQNFLNLSFEFENSKFEYFEFETFGQNFVNFFHANCFYLCNETTETTNLSFTERLQHSKPSCLPKSSQKLHKIYKNLIFCIFVSFGLNLMHFFNTNCFYLFKEASTTTNLFLFKRPYHYKPPSFSKKRQKVHKSFKNQNFQVFGQFRSEFVAFFSTQIAFFLQGSVPDNESFPSLTSLTF